MIENVKGFGQPNCLKLSNGRVELIATTDIGPRILRYGFPGQDNILGECPEAAVQTPLGEWKPRGGHRLWTAPEAIPRSYVPDNSPIEFETEGDDTIHLSQPVEAPTGIRKEMILTLDRSGTRVTVRHRITNENLWAIEVAPWALTIMNGGGAVVLPQEPFRSHDEYLLPARPMVLWHYTDLSDPRFTLGTKYLRLRTDAARDEPQKIGIANKQGWAAYLRKRTLFVKQFDYQEGAAYPDDGCNCESYTAASFIELETLAPLHQLEPGEPAEHVEVWHLFENVDVGASEDALDAAIAPLIAEISGE